jgi:hypothetical protein
MNIQLHRKQIIMLVLAMLLAIVSYWIPLPQQPVPAVEPPKLSEPVEKTQRVEPVVFARESATMWRFPITVAVPQTVQEDPVIRYEEPRPAPPWAARQLIGAWKTGDSETFRSGKPTFAPPEDRERSFQ